MTKEITTMAEALESYRYPRLYGTHEDYWHVSTARWSELISLIRILNVKDDCAAYDRAMSVLDNQ